MIFFPFVEKLLSSRGIFRERKVFFDHKAYLCNKI